MFYYRIERQTRARPRVKSETYEQFGTLGSAGARAGELIGGGLYDRVTVESVSQGAYARATRGGK